MDYILVVRTSRCRKDYEDDDYPHSDDISAPYKLVYTPPLNRDGTIIDFFQTSSFDSLLDEIRKQTAYLESIGENVSVVFGLKMFSRKSVNAPVCESREQRLERTVKEIFQEPLRIPKKRKMKHGIRN